MEYHADRMGQGDFAIMSLRLSTIQLTLEMRGRA